MRSKAPKAPRMLQKTPQTRKGALPIGTDALSLNLAVQRLTEADRTFLESFLEDGNATRAYHAAGFNGNNPGPNAYKMLHKRSIQAALTLIGSKTIRALERKFEVTVGGVLLGIETARQGAIEDKQFAAALKGSELHGKFLGMFGEDFHTQDQAPLITINSCNGNTQVIVGKRPQYQALPDPDLPLEELTDADLT